MNKYKVGDKIKIKSEKEINAYLDINSDFESGWIPEMYKYCGLTATVNKVGAVENTYRIDIDREGLEWNAEMFEGNIIEEMPNTKDYYKGKDSLYKFGYEWQLNSWEQDIIKRVVRCRYKGTWEEDLLKTIDVIKIYLQEYKQLKQEENVED